MIFVLNCRFWFYIFKFVPIMLTSWNFRFELALQQNEIMDVFCDDWKALADEDSTFGSKSDNHLKVRTVSSQVRWILRNLIKPPPSPFQLKGSSW